MMRQRSWKCLLRAFFEQTSLHNTGRAYGINHILGLTAKIGMKDVEFMELKCRTIFEAWIRR